MRPSLAGRLAVCIAPFTLIACDGENTKAPAPETAVVRSSQEPDSLNPFLTGMSVATDASQPIYSGLLAVNEKMRFIPDLALNVPTAENGGVQRHKKGMVVTYRLRPDVKWHDGVPFTSRDVAFTARILQDPRVQVVEREGYDLIERVETPSAHLVRIYFKEIYAPYLKLFRAVLPYHRLKDAPDINRAPFNRHPIGTGPYLLVDWRAGERLIYRANPHYFRGKPAIKNLEFRIVPDDNSAFVQLKNGAIDVYQNVNLGQFRSLRQLKNVKVHQTPALLWEHLSFNLEKTFFQDVRVRKAIAHAIDKNMLSQKVYEGLWKPAWCDQNPLSWAYAPSLENKTPYDPQEAQRLLDEAGWKRGPDGIRLKNGERFSVSFATTAGRKTRETSQLLIRHFLRAVGIEVVIDNHPGVTLFAAWPQGLLKGGKFDMAMWAWDTGPDPDNLNTWHSQRIPPKGGNQTRYKNPEVDHLLESATRTFEQAERQKIYRRVSTILADDLPNIPLLYWTVLDLVQDRLEGFRPNPTNAGNLWNVYEWRLKK
ncbi:MAG: peptide ABC transporter substrate-binding protein [Candidatus Sericytochromatia bacterium]|nr:peptide ABC transporter substrate-binding protein [Candidatus Sericytochromatia bacterium]